LNIHNHDELKNLNMKRYGIELILDLRDYNSKKFNRKDIDVFFTELCNVIDMKKCEIYFWDDVGGA